MPETNITLGATLPGEAFAVALLKFLTVLVEGQTAEQKKQLWDMYIAHAKAWQDFWGLVK